MTRKTFILSIFAMAFTSLAEVKNITVKGSDTMVILGQTWAEVYMQKNPNIRIQVTGGGSGTGFAALQNNQTDLANASRPIKSKEVEQCLKAFGRRPMEHVVALDGITVYINEKNRLTALSLEQINDIFTGKITNWKEVGGDDSPIIVYSRENSSGTYEFFKEHVLKNKDFHANVQTMAGTAQVIQSVARDANSIGYGGVAYGKGIKHVNVSADKNSEAVEATEENVLSGKYPISRSLFIYMNPKLHVGDIKKYIDWIKSDEGQEVVKNIGYYPIPKDKRNK